MISTQIVNHYCTTTKTPLLTPIAASMFNLPEIMQAATHRSLPPEIIARMLNASTVSGGALPDDSEASCAAAAIITSTTRMATPKDRVSSEKDHALLLPSEQAL